MRQDVQSLYGVAPERIRVIHNGIDLQQYRPTPNPQTLAEFGIRPDQPFVLFVGRITRQKGILHLVNAIRHFHPGLQVVLCAGAPDTPEIGREMTDAVAQARAATRNKIIWIPEMLPREKVIALYTHAAIFVCPSVYEPFGIINLEAMACETPVVASAVGGIPEVVEHGDTGLLVPAETLDHSEVEPRHPEQFARDLAAAVNTLLDDPALRASMARSGPRARRTAVQLDQHRAARPSSSTPKCSRCSTSSSTISTARVPDTEPVCLTRHAPAICGASRPVARDRRRRAGGPPSAFRDASVRIGNASGSRTRSQAVADEGQRYCVSALLGGSGMCSRSTLTAARARPPCKTLHRGGGRTGLRPGIAPGVIRTP